MHKSGMVHDRHPTESCFFCQDCTACGGSGGIGGLVKTQHSMRDEHTVSAGCDSVSHVSQRVSQGCSACPHCAGLGHCHTNQMAHDRGPTERCFFCEECSFCAGSGQVPEELGFGQLPPPGELMPCRGCEGKGFRHTDPSAHDRASDERCFFCTDCCTCGGRGWADPASMRHPLQTSASPPGACPHCDGKGFRHPVGAASSAHDRSANERCFFCEDCTACGGCGMAATHSSSRVNESVVVELG